MADDVDAIEARLEREDERRKKARGDTPYQPPAGVSGDCDLCNEWCGRLVGGACPPCRDKHGLP